jgi:hypothetical protein
MTNQESRVEQERRVWVERQERFKDVQETYEQDQAAATTREERKQLMQVFAKQRRAHREEDVRLGKRLPGVSVSMHRIMWATWIEVAVEHELEAREALQGIVANLDNAGDQLVREFQVSLVAVTSAADAIEAVFGDIKYRIPVQPPRDKRHKVLRHAFSTAFGLSGQMDQRLGRELSWLFTLRDSAAHPYAESESPLRHPAGPNTGAEHSRFNALTSGRAVDAAMTVIAAAESPPKPLNRWVERWALERAAYHAGVVASLRSDRDSYPLPTL